MTGTTRPDWRILARKLRWGEEIRLFSTFYVGRGKYLGICYVRDDAAPFPDDMRRFYGRNALEGLEASRKERAARFDADDKRRVELGKEARSFSLKYRKWVGW